MKKGMTGITVKTNLLIEAKGIRFPDLKVSERIKYKNLNAL